MWRSHSPHMLYCHKVFFNWGILEDVVIGGSCEKNFNDQLWFYLYESGVF